MENERIMIIHSKSHYVLVDILEYKRALQWNVYHLLFNCTCFGGHQMSVLVGEGRGPPVNKFEQVSSDDHRMSLGRFNASWVMVT